MASKCCNIKNYNGEKGEKNGAITQNSIDHSILYFHWNFCVYRGSQSMVWLWIASSFSTYLWNTKNKTKETNAKKSTREIANGMAKNPAIFSNSALYSCVFLSFYYPKYFENRAV